MALAYLSSAVQIVLKLALSIAAITAIAAILPFLAVATYSFPNFDDTTVFATIRSFGLFYSIEWYYDWVMSRVTTGTFRVFLAWLSDFLGLNIWQWNQLASVIYFSMVPFGVGAILRIVLPALSWSWTVVLACLAFVTSLCLVRSSLTFDPSSTFIYFMSFFTYCLFLAVFYRHARGPHAGWRSGGLLCLVFLLYLGSHEIALIAGPMVIAVSFLLSFQLNRGTAAPLATAFPWNRVRIGFHAIPDLDRPSLIWLTITLVVVTAIAAAIHVFAPNIGRRAGAWALYATDLTLLEAIRHGTDLFMALAQRLVRLDEPLPLLMGILTFLVAVTTPVRESLKSFGLSFLLLPTVGFVGVGLTGAIAVIALSGPGQMADRVVHYALMYGILSMMAAAILLANLAPFRLIPVSLARTGAFAVLMVMAWQVWTNGAFATVRDASLGAGWAYREGVAERIAKMEAGAGGTARVHEIERPSHPVSGAGHGPPSEKAYQRNLELSFGLKKLVFTPCGDSIDPFWCHYRFNPLDGQPPEVLPEGQYEGPRMELQRKRLAGEK